MPELIALAAAPGAELAAAYARFEAAFTYPLGPEARFRIDHGGDPTAFFRAQGTARMWLALNAGVVVGAVAVAVRTLAGSGRAIAYVGDLKVAPTLGGRRALPALLRAAHAWGAARAEAAYAVVMDGGVAPDRYAARAGVPGLRRVDGCAVLRLAGDPGGAAAHLVAALAEAPVAAVAGVRPVGGDPGLRSLMSPRWVATADGGAWGRIEDTRRAKRLHLVGAGGDELRAAHLGGTCWPDPAAGARLLRGALAQAQAAGLPALFTAVRPEDVAELGRHLAGVDVRVAGASVFATASAPAGRWCIDTAEI
jgi:hypothetical protein